MSRFTLLRGARQLLTLGGPEGARSGPALQNLGAITDGSVLIEDGRVVVVGSTRRLENLKEAKTALEIDVHGSVVMPGFVDPGLRISLDASGAVPKRPKGIRQMHQETLNLLRSCVLNGTLTAELKGTAAGGSFRADLGVLRRLAKIGDSPAGTVRCWHLTRVPESDTDVTEFCETLQRLERHPLVQFIELPVNDGTVLSQSLVRGLRSSSIRVKLYWSGWSASVLASLLNDTNPYAIFFSSALSPRELQLLSGFGGTVVFAPGREIGEAGLSGASAAVEAGFRVALSSGYDAVRYPAYSMQMAVSMASLYGGLTLEQAITAATVNAAHAVGWGGTHGCLMQGKRADILVLNVPDYREIPRQFGINNVRMVLRDGEVVLNRAGWKLGAHETSLPGRVRAQRIGGA